jgi:hypothetical protein
MPAKKQQRRASRYAELARKRSHRAAQPSLPAQRPPAERIPPPPIGNRVRPSPQVTALPERPLVAAELRRIGLIGGLMFLLLFGLSRFLG